MTELAAIIALLTAASTATSALVASHEAEIAAKNKIIADLQNQLNNLPLPPKFTNRRKRK